MRRLCRNRNQERTFVR